MGKFSQHYYAVRRGHTPGIYHTWSQCDAQVRGFKGAEYKKFLTFREADAFRRGMNPSHASPIRKLDDSAVAKEKQNGRRAKERSDPPRKVPLLCSQAMRILYTDGSALNNGRTGARAGWAVYWGPLDSRNQLGPVDSGEMTNNRGELMAIREALNTIAKQPSSPPKIYEIRSDSKYSISCITEWSEKWDRNGWISAKGEPVKNQDLIKAIREARRSLLANGIETRFTYVAAHNGEPGNEAADRMAKLGATGKDSE